MRRVRRKELASMFGVSVSTVSSWRTRYSDFPQPIGRYYDFYAVAKWRAKHIRLEKPHERGTA